MRANSYGDALGDFLLDRRLRELSKGARQGYPKSMTEGEAIRARREEKESRGEEFNRATDVPLLESEQDAVARFSDWLIELVRDAVLEFNDNKTNGDAPTSKSPSIFCTLVVSHSALLRSALMSMFTKEKLIASGATFDSPTHLVIPNTSLTIVDVTPDLENDCWQSQTCLDVSKSGDNMWKATLVEFGWTGHYDLIPKE